MKWALWTRNMGPLGSKHGHSGRVGSLELVDHVGLALANRLKRHLAPSLAVVLRLKRGQHHRVPAGGRSRGQGRRVRAAGRAARRAAGGQLPGAPRHCSIHSHAAEAGGGLGGRARTARAACSSGGRRTPRPPQSWPATGRQRSRHPPAAWPLQAGGQVGRQGKARGSKASKLAKIQEDKEASCVLLQGRRDKSMVGSTSAAPGRQGGGGQALQRASTGRPQPNTRPRPPAA